MVRTSNMQFKKKKNWLKLSSCLCTVKRAGHGSESTTGIVLVEGRKNLPQLCRSAHMTVD